MRTMSSCDRRANGLALSVCIEARQPDEAVPRAGSCECATVSIYVVYMSDKSIASQLLAHVPYP